MQLKKAQTLYKIVLLFKNDMERTVPVKATSREIAEDRALKRNPSAVGVKR